MKTVELTTQELVNIDGGGVIKDIITKDTGTSGPYDPTGPQR